MTAQESSPKQQQEACRPYVTDTFLVQHLHRAAGPKRLTCQADTRCGFIQGATSLALTPNGMGCMQKMSSHVLDGKCRKELRAVRSGKVAVADGHQMFNRPGPRWVL